MTAPAADAGALAVPLSVLHGADTVWGIPGASFLVGYGVIGLLALGVAASVLRAQLVPIGRPATAELRPVELAMITGGTSLALTVTVMKLRALGVVDRHGLRTGSGAAADHVSSVVRAVNGGVPASGPISYQALAADPAVASALAGVGERLQRQGLLTTPSGRREARVAAALIETVVAIGLLRFAVAHDDLRPTILLLAEVAVLQLAGGMLLLAPPAHTRTGQRAVRRQRIAHPHLDPSRRDGWAGYGPQAPVLSTALYGAAVAWAHDREFAALTGLPGDPGPSKPGSTLAQVPLG